MIFSSSPRTATIVLGLVSLAAGLSACGGGSSAPSAPSASTVAAPATDSPAATRTGKPVAVDLSEYDITPSDAMTNPGPVTINATNSGNEPHELIVLKTDTQAADLPVSAGRAAEDGSVGEIGADELSPGASASTTLDLAPGHYALICNIPGHYGDGMSADLEVK